MTTRATRTGKWLLIGEGEDSNSQGTVRLINLIVFATVVHTLLLFCGAFVGPPGRVGQWE